MKKLVVVGAIACLVAVSLMATPAHAQRWGRFRGRNYGVVYGSSYYYPSDYYGWGYAVGPAYYTPYAASNYGWGPVVGQYTYGDTLNYGINSYVAPAAWDTSNAQYSSNAQNRNTYQSMYSPANADARIRVNVPDSNAQVFFDDSPTRQTGMERLFTSPPLDPSKSYTYTIRATWMDNGKEVTRTKDVKVQSGRTSIVDFRAMNDTNDLTIPNPREDKGDQKSPGIDSNKESKSLPLPGGPTDKKSSANPPDKS
jgi:uncharacterized protein (TIGR03000 family)